MDAVHRGTITDAAPARSDDGPLFSILSPTFNHERFILDCLKSVRQQSDGRWEQIVVDDGSDDGTVDLVRQHADPRVTVLELPHRGIYHLAESYNAALAIARGRFVAVLEGDDVWPPDKLERQLAALADPAVVLSWGLVGITTASGAFVRAAPAVDTVRSMQRRAPGEVMVDLLRINFIPSSTVVCRREALLAIGGFQQPLDLPTADYPTWLAMCRVGRFAPVEHILGYHRAHDDSVTAVMRDELAPSLVWGARWVAALPDAELKRLGIDREQVRAIERSNRADHDYAMGRAALRRGRHQHSRTLLRQAVRQGRLTTKAKATLGLAASALGVDFDRAIAALRRRPS